MAMTTTTRTMTIEAFAKVNFTLEVFGKRPDGYHALRSLVVPVSLCDTLEVEPSDGVSSDTGFADDLCVAAVHALRRRTGRSCGASIRVTKRIPAGGGLGGGSADAAAVLAALNEAWGCGLLPEELAAVGAEVGSDVPALVLSRTCGPVVMEGRGEAVRPFDGAFPALEMVLANPAVHSSTREVFARCSPRVTGGDDILYNMRNALVSGDLRRIADAMVNDLQSPAVELHPEIAASLALLAECGATGAAMSGSGSSVFGLVESAEKGEEVAEALKARGLAAWSVHAIVP